MPWRNRSCLDGVKTHILWKARNLTAFLTVAEPDDFMNSKMISNPKSRTGFSFAFIVIVATLFLSVFKSHSPLQAQEPAPSDDSQAVEDTPSAQVGALLSQLDSPSFQERERATDDLIRVGPDVIKPLIVHFFNASSEAGWRIHRILEGVGKNGEEKDFLKSIAIIQVLYGTQDSQSQQRLAKLQFQWKATRRSEAAKKLGKMGFKFNSPNGNPQDAEDAAVELMRLEMMARAAEFREVGGVRIAVTPDEFESDTNSSGNAENKWADPRANRQKSIIEIEKIIAGSADENRKIVEALLPASFKVDLPPGTLEIPEDWKSDKESLKLINDLSSLYNLTFRNQKIDSELQKFISGQSALKGLQLIDCEFDTNSNELVLPRSLSGLHFVGSLPPADSFSSLGQINSLKLENISLDEELATALSRCKIQTLSLEEVKFTRESIRQLVSMRGLFRVSMSLCQFKLEWLEDIRRRNPNLINASPKAFLGVQGSIDIRGREFSGCQISQVVPDTAAANAGMKSLDIVTAMDGEKIVRFEDLRLLISQKRPGDTMELEVRRGDEKVNLTVELGTIGQSVP